VRGQIQDIPAGEVFDFLHSRPEGLTPAEVAERLREVGPNAIETRRRYQWLGSLVRQFTNFFAVLLYIAAAFCFVSDRVQPGESMNILGLALLGVAVLNGLFGFIQEYRAERAMEELRKLLPPKVVAVRAGREETIAADQLVPGDVLKIAEGDRIPADGRLIECQDLVVNNAPLTGESRPVRLTAAPRGEHDSEAVNLLLAGCAVWQGRGTAVVYATGHRTEFGKIATLAQDVRRKISPLEREVASMVRVLTLIAAATGAIFFVYGMFAGFSLWTNLVFMVGIIVALVPEGLLPTLTLSLAMGSLRMARRNVLVKSLNAVEALGAVHVICTDKTGTLTLNQMSVTAVIDPVAGADIGGEARRETLALALVASDVRRTETGLSGGPLDVAVAKAYAQSGQTIESVNDTVVHRFSFNVRKRRAAGIARHDGTFVFCVKGAWESLKPLIAHVEAPGEAKPVAADEPCLARAEDIVRRLASEGRRVLAVAYARLAAMPDPAAPQELFERGLVLKGFLGAEDPIRPEVPAAVERCHRAGIRVTMVTGDHPRTAEAIARKAGIVPAGTEAAVLTGDDLDSLRKTELIERLGRGVHVFARTTPEQKWKIVAALHDLDRVVAMTGDGVNDAPALRAADVGVAMGRSGTDVAREAAQVILLDDNFASIVRGIEEGRAIFTNIRKFTDYVLASNGPEIVPYLVYMVLPVPLALTIIQILSIDLGTDIVPAIGLGQEKPDPETMDNPPRDRRERLLNWPLVVHSYLFLGVIEAGFALALFFWVLVQGGWSYGAGLAAQDPLYRAATGITLSSIILMQIGNLVGRRSRFGPGIDRDVLRNPLIAAGIAIEIVFSWAVLYFPPVSDVLGTGPVEPAVYAAAWLGPFLIYGLDYGRKRIAQAWRRAGTPPAFVMER
jgi:sodium/potassium-transporting ATPase subunit alpha